MARKRLNVKFLVVLVSVAGLLLVGLAVAGWWYKESPGRAIRRAQEAEERGDWEKAAEQWAKAARASNDPEYLLKAIDASMKRTAERVHVVAEGAAGCAVAAALSGQVPGRKIVAIVSGGNIDLSKFAALVNACEPH